MPSARGGLLWRCPVAVSLVLLTRVCVIGGFVAQVVQRFVGPSTREKIQFLYGKDVTDVVLAHFDPSARHPPSLVPLGPLALLSSLALTIRSGPAAENELRLRAADAAARAGSGRSDQSSDRATRADDEASQFIAFVDSFLPPQVLPKEYGGTLERVNFVDRGPALWERQDAARLRRY